MIGMDLKLHTKYLYDQLFRCENENDVENCIVFYCLDDHIQYL